MPRKLIKPKFHREPTRRQDREVGPAATIDRQLVDRGLIDVVANSFDSTLTEVESATTSTVTEAPGRYQIGIGGGITTDFHDQAFTLVIGEAAGLDRDDVSSRLKADETESTVRSRDHCVFTARASVCQSDGCAGNDGAAGVGHRTGDGARDG